MAEAKTRVLNVGNCDPDHVMLGALLAEHFDTAVDRAMYVDEALERMRRRRYDLVLFNRLIFADGSEGIELLRRAKADDAMKAVPIMMISNLGDAQETSRAAGGELGFGKAAVSEPATVALLSRYLPRKLAART